MRRYLYLLQESPCFCEVKLSNLSRCVTCEVSLQNCKGFVIDIFYRSPIQDNTEFLLDCDERLSKIVSSNSFFTVILGGCIARSSS